MRASFFTPLHLFAAVLLLGVSLPALAERDPCKGPKPVGRDAENLEAAVLGAVGRQRAPDLDIRDVHLCHLSPKISVRLESARTRNRDGVQEWLTVQCWRPMAERRWDCFSEPQRAIELRTTLAGAERKLDLTPVDNRTVDTERDLALRSLALLNDSGSMPQRCASDSTTDLRTWPDRRRYALERLASTDKPMRVQSEQHSLAPGVTRIVFFEGLAIEYPSVCWSAWEEIVVMQ